MKNLATLFTIALILFAQASFAQKAKTIKLNQTPGKFNKTELTLKEGTYVFEIANKGVDHEVGLY